VDREAHFCVARTDLVDRCMTQLVGDPEKGGRYFTIWAPRQTGKTWLVQQVKKEIEKPHGDRFAVKVMSVQGVILKQDDPPEAFLTRIPLLFQRFFDQFVEEPKDGGKHWARCFTKTPGFSKSP